MYKNKRISSLGEISQRHGIGLIIRFFFAAWEQLVFTETRNSYVFFACKEEVLQSRKKYLNRFADCTIFGVVVSDFSFVSSGNLPFTFFFAQIFWGEWNHLDCLGEANYHGFAGFSKFRFVSWSHTACFLTVREILRREKEREKIQPCSPWIMPLRKKSNDLKN